MAYAKSMNDIGTLALIGGLVGAVTGLVVGTVLTNALDSAVAMVYVCFAESPAALQVPHIFLCTYFFFLLIYINSASLF